MYSYQKSGSKRHLRTNFDVVQIKKQLKEITEVCHFEPKKNKTESKYQIRFLYISVT